MKRLLPILLLLTLFLMSCDNQGVKLFRAKNGVLQEDPPPEVVLDIHVEDHGVSPDNADNASQLIAMRDKLIRQGREHHYKITFPPGLFRYSNNRWLTGLSSVEVTGTTVPNPTGSGTPRPVTTLQNISTLPSQGDVMPFEGKSISEDRGDVQRTPQAGKPYSFYLGHLLTQCQVLPSGSQTVMIDVPSSGGPPVSFNPGDRIMIGGLNQQTGGFPLNVRYFEFNEVSQVSIYSQTLIVTLKNPLKNSYNCVDWWDFIYPWFIAGKPRIYKLERENYNHFKDIKLSNFFFLPAPGKAHLGTPIVFSGTHVEINNVRGDFAGFNIWIRETENTTVAHSLVGGSIEVDKQVVNATIRKNLIRGMRAAPLPTATPSPTPLPRQAITAATSCDKLRIEDNQMEGPVNVVCKNTTIKSNKIDISTPLNSNGASAIQFYNGNWGGKQISILSNHIIKKTTQNAINSEPREAFTMVLEEDLQVSIVEVEAKKWVRISVPESNATGRVMGFYPGSRLLSSTGQPFASFTGYKYDALAKRVVLTFQILGTSAPTLQEIKSAKFTNFLQVVEEQNTVDDIP